MLESPCDIRPTETEGRFIIKAVYDGDGWEIVVEPDELNQLLVVVTAYRPS